MKRSWHKSHVSKGSSKLSLTGGIELFVRFDYLNIPKRRYKKPTWVASVNGTRLPMGSETKADAEEYAMRECEQMLKIALGEIKLVHVKL